MPDNERDARDFAHLKLRCRESLRARIEQKAAEHGCSINAEMVNRLERSLEAEDELEKAREIRSADGIAAIREAGFQLVRGMGGETTINISPEMLLREADGITRNGFIAREVWEEGYSPLEASMKRIMKEVLEEHGVIKPKARTAA
jgi:hypothetical protein